MDEGDQQNILEVEDDGEEPFTDPVEEEGYSPVDSPEVVTAASVGGADNDRDEEGSPPFRTTGNRKRGLELDSDDNDGESEDIVGKRPRVDNNEEVTKGDNESGAELEDPIMESKKSGQSPKQAELNANDDEDDDDTSIGIFGEDSNNEEEEEGEEEGTGEGGEAGAMAFTDMVDEIDEDEDEGVELGEEGAELQNQQPEETEVAGGSSDSDVDDKRGGGATSESLSDFDIMMQRRKEAMSRARKRRRKDDIDINPNDDNIQALLQQMKYAAEEDCRMNLKKQPAVKKLTLLPTVISHLKKVDLLNAFIENGICSALADWLKPLPDHSLPHLKIREDLLDSLLTFPQIGSHILKTSGLGKAIMLLYRHPKEIKKNRLKAGKLINDWSRPIFGLNSDYKSLNCSEREKRDWARLSQTAKRRLSSSAAEGGQSSSSQQTQEESSEAKPGDKGWIPRARVPMPSYKDYVVRPKWNVEGEMKKGSSKKVLNRYEKQIQKNRDKQSVKKNTHAVSISIEGRKMPL